MIRHTFIVVMGLLWAMQAFADFSSEEFFKILKNGDYAIISAGRNMNDPSDKKLSDKEIADRTAKLEKKLKLAKFKYHKVVGHYMALEESFFISTDKKYEELFLELGQKFKQESIIVGSGGNQKLVYTSGKDKGFVNTGAGYALVGQEQKDFYTELVTTDGKKIRFSLNLDFDRKCRNKVHTLIQCQSSYEFKQ